MTNAEKFEEVFGFEPNVHSCMRRECTVKLKLADLLDKLPVILDCGTCSEDYWDSEYEGVEKCES